MSDPGNLPPNMVDRVAIEDRGFTSACWVWTGPVHSSGYGKVSCGRAIGAQLAHRWSYTNLVGPIPRGLVIDHLCRVPLCVNPGHLEPVPQRENLRRGLNQVAENMVKTHCKRGHEFTPENTYIPRDEPSPRRICRACVRERDAIYRARRVA